MGDQPKVDNLLHISWCDSMSVPILNTTNVMEYFSERSNPFYSRDCNNEFIKMQQNTRPEQLQHMQGTEYILLHAQDPVLFIIRKQQRFSPTQANPLAAYHLIAGQVFQTPDLGSVINSRLVSSVSHLNSAFTEMQSYAHYHPSRGYWWETRKQPDAAEQQKKEKEKKSSRKEEAASIFQRRRVDLLLGDLAVKFPYKPPPQQAITAAAATATNGQQQTSQTQSATGGQQQQSATDNSKQGDTSKPEVKADIKMEIKNEMKIEPKIDIKVEPNLELKQETKVDVKTEVKLENSQPSTHQRPSSKPPPEKRQRLGN